MELRLTCDQAEHSLPPGSPGKGSGAHRAWTQQWHSPIYQETSWQTGRLAPFPPPPPLFSSSVGAPVKRQNPSLSCLQKPTQKVPPLSHRLAYSGAACMQPREIGDREREMG